MKNNFVNLIVKSVFAISVIFVVANEPVYAASTGEIKKKAHTQVSNKTYRYGKTFYYFSSNGSVYYAAKNGQVRRNFWNIRYTPSTKKLKACFVINTETTTAAIRTSYCQTPAELARAKVGNGDIHNLARSSRFK